MPGMKAHDGSGTPIPRHPGGVLTPLRLLVHRLLQVPVRAGVPEKYEEHHRQGLRALFECHRTR
jgi:hypothetical protein